MTDIHTATEPATGQLTRPGRRGSTAAAAFAIVGTVAAVLAQFVIPALPLSHGHSLNEATGLCNGALGELARAFDHGIASQCATWGNTALALHLTALAGLVTAVIAAVAWYRFRRATA